MRRGWETIAGVTPRKETISPQFIVPRAHSFKNEQTGFVSQSLGNPRDTPRSIMESIVTVGQGESHA